MTEDTSLNNKISPHKEPISTPVLLLGLIAILVSVMLIITLVALFRSPSVYEFRADALANQQMVNAKIDSALLELRNRMNGRDIDQATANLNNANQLGILQHRVEVLETKLKKDGQP